MSCTPKAFKKVQTVAQLAEWLLSTPVHGLQMKYVLAFGYKLCLKDKTESKTRNESFK